MKVRSSTRATSPGSERGVVAVGSLGVGELGEGSVVDEQLTQLVVLFGRSVTPVDTIGGCEPRHLLDPFDQLLVLGWVRHGILIHNSHAASLRRDTWTTVMTAPTDPTRERSQHEDDVLERIAKIVARDTVPDGRTPRR